MAYEQHLHQPSSPYQTGEYTIAQNTPTASTPGSGGDDFNQPLTASGAFIGMSPLFQAKLVTMFVLCGVSILLGVIPVKLVRLFNLKALSCSGHTHSHGGRNGNGDNLEPEQPLIMSLLLCFGGGVLLSTTFLHLQPEVRDSMDALARRGETPKFFDRHDIPLADLVMCVGFFLVYIIEEVVHFILDLGLNHREDEAVLHRTMSLRKCSGRSYRRGAGQMIPRVSLNNGLPSSSSLSNNNVIGNRSVSTTSAPLPPSSDASLLSISSSSRQILLENGNGGGGGVNGLATTKRVPATTIGANNSSRQMAGQSPSAIIQPSPTMDTDTSSVMDSVEETTAKKSFRGLFTILALSFHEVFEGLAVGLQRNVQNVWYLLAAIATHKFVLSFCLGMELMSTRTRIPVVVLYICTFAIVTPVGITVGILLSAGPTQETPDATLITVVLQGIACGTLVYVTFFEILQREKANSKSGILQLFAIMVGFTFMLFLQFFAGHEHMHDHGSDHDHVHHHHDHSHHESDHDSHFQ